MGRKARVLSDYLHVIVRGVGKRILFEDDYDRMRFLKLLKKHKDETGVAIVAYCLMDNHVHLLIRDEKRNVSAFMQKQGVAYALYFNNKYERTGHLFQNRFISECVTDDRYLLDVYRYILKNPEKAGISAAKKYQWSSYLEYGRNDGLTDTSSLKKKIGSPRAFDDFMSKKDDNEYMEYFRPKHDDEWALSVLKKNVGVSDSTEIAEMSKNARDKVVLQLLEAGVSVRQLERLTGVPKSVIYKIKK